MSLDNIILTSEGIKIIDNEFLGCNSGWILNYRNSFLDENFKYREFVSDEIPWAHIDIAGPAFADSPWGEHPKGGTGFGVRLLVNVIENF